MKSLKSLFVSGKGPSSSHTIGPSRACLHFLNIVNNKDIKNIEATLYGSFALTYKGHHTDKVIFNKITQMCIFFITHGCFQRNRLFGNFHYLFNFFGRHIQTWCQFFRCRFMARFHLHLMAGAQHFVDCFNHMDRNTNRSGLISDSTGNGLTNPPCGIG